MIIWISRAKNYKKNQDNLRGRGEFAINAWWKWPVTRDQENHHRDNEDQHIAAENEDGKPPGQLLLERQEDERGREQEFVGDGIEIRAESRSLIQTARKQAVKTIGKAGDDSNQKRQPVMIVGHEHEQHRLKAETPKRHLTAKRPAAGRHW